MKEYSNGWRTFLPEFNPAGESMIRDRKNYSGVFCGALSSILWGIVPLYWKLLKQVPPDEILAHRIVWSLLFLLVLVTFQKKTGHFIANFKNPKDVLLSLLSAVFLCLNWLVYIWAVNSNHVVEASMGYYINPILSVLLGVVFFKEKLRRCQKAALFFAAAGVAILLFSYGGMPWISLVIAGSFAVYGLLKKLTPFDAVTGFSMETVLIFPFALAFIVDKQISGTGALGSISPTGTVLLLCTGVVTAVPFLLFAESAKKIKLSALGFLQYFSPTISFLLGIFAFHEKLTSYELISFIFIWVAIILYSSANLIHNRLKSMTRRA
jgi:chloramphenicol-sensitive protein RarD